MPAPTNTSIGTAINIGTTLPYTITQEAHDGGITYSLWYEYTAQATDVVVGVFGYGVPFGTYLVRTWVYYDGIEDAAHRLADTGGGPLNSNRPVQFAVTPGTTYQFRFQPPSGNPNPAELHLQVQVFTQGTGAMGSIVVPDDSNARPLVIIDPTTGTKRFVNPFPDGEAGDVLNDGTMAMWDESDDVIEIYDDQFNLTTSIPSVTLPSLGSLLRTCQGTQRFWFTYFSAPGVISARYVEDDGTLGTPHLMTAVTSMFAMAVQNDESILYHTPVNSSAIKRWDLVNDVALSDLVATTANYRTGDIIVLGDDTIVATYIKTTVTTDSKVRRFDDDTTLLNTYDFGSAIEFPGGTLPRLAYAIDDPTSFWVWLHATDGVSEFKEIQVSDGTVLDTVTSQEYENGVYQGAPTETPTADFGNSFSCPFWILRAEFPTGGGGGTGTIRVVKVTVPESDEQSFDFVAGGGLTPTDFSLQGGDEQVYNTVTVGDGYSVIETPNLNYQTTVSVNNGSPNTNLTVAEDEIVVVTFTNSSVIAPGFNTRAVKRRWLRRSPIYSTANARVRWKVFSLDCEVGTGTNAEPGMNPVVYMTYSSDSGQTWSFVIPREMGMLGKWQTQLQWWQLGIARAMVIEVYGSDPVKVALLDGWAKVDPGTDND